MRKVLLHLFSAAALLLAGCESSGGFSSRVRERFEAPVPQKRVFEVDQRTVFFAAQAALKRMDYRLTRTAAARGQIRAVSEIQAGDSLRDARQYEFDITVTDLADQKTEVAVVLHEQQESASFSGATDVPLRQHGLYDSFFEMLAAVLKEGFTPPPAS